MKSDNINPREPKPYDPVEEADLLRLLEMLDDPRVEGKIIRIISQMPRVQEKMDSVSNKELETIIKHHMVKLASDPNWIKVQQELKSKKENKDAIEKN